MVEPKIVQKKPYAVDLESGVYAWCGCGLSKTDPMCDGTHKGTEYEGTDCAAKLFEIEEEEKTVHLCGCKHTKTPPYCDGSHSKLP